MFIRLPSLGSFRVGMPEISRVINRGQAAPVVATSQHGAGARHSCWFEAGSVHRSRSGRALVFTIGQRHYTIPVQSVSLLLSRQRQYAAVAAMTGPPVP